MMILLLFIDMMLSIPGLLALASLTAERKPAAGYAARILSLIGGRQPSRLSSWARC